MRRRRPRRPGRWPPAEQHAADHEAQVAEGLADDPLVGGRVQPGPHDPVPVDRLDPPDHAPVGGRHHAGRMVGHAGQHGDLRRRPPPSRRPGRTGGPAARRSRAGSSASRSGSACRLRLLTGPGPPAWRQRRRPEVGEKAPRRPGRPRLSAPDRRSGWPLRGGRVGRCPPRSPASPAGATSPRHTTAGRYGSGGPQPALPGPDPLLQRPGGVGHVQRDRSYHRLHRDAPTTA